MQSKKNQNISKNIYPSNMIYSNNLSSLNSNIFNIPNLNSYKINYYPLFPFLSYENTNFSNDKNPNNCNLSFGMEFLNDYDRFKNYINFLNQQKSWQQFSSFLISNINNAEKNIILKNSIKNFIGTKTKRDNENIKVEEKVKFLKNEKIQNNINLEENKIIEEKMENGNENDMNKISKKDLVKKRKNKKFQYKFAVKNKIKKSKCDFSIIINNSNYKDEKDINSKYLIDKKNKIKKESSENENFLNNENKKAIFPNNENIKIHKKIKKYLKK